MKFRKKTLAELIGGSFEAAIKRRIKEIGILVSRQPEAVLDKILKYYMQYYGEDSGLSFKGGKFTDEDNGKVLGDKKAKADYILGTDPIVSEGGLFDFIATCQRRKLLPKFKKAKVNTNRSGG